MGISCNLADTCGHWYLSCGCRFPVCGCLWAWVSTLRAYFRETNLQIGELNTTDIFFSIYRNSSFSFVSNFSDLPVLVCYSMLCVHIF